MAHEIVAHTPSSENVVSDSTQQIALPTQVEIPKLDNLTYIFVYQKGLVIVLLLPMFSAVENLTILPQLNKKIRKTITDNPA